MIPRALFQPWAGRWLKIDLNKPPGGEVCAPRRVLCADATSVEAVARLLGDCQPLLLVTDPPYGTAASCSDFEASHPWRRARRTTRLECPSYAKGLERETGDQRPGPRQRRKLRRRENTSCCWEASHGSGFVDRSEAARDLSQRVVTEG